MKNQFFNDHHFCIMFNENLWANLKTNFCKALYMTNFLTMISQKLKIDQNCAHNSTFDCMGRKRILNNDWNQDEETKSMKCYLQSKNLSKKYAEKIALRWLKTKSSRNFVLAIQLEEPELHDSYDLCEIYLEKFFPLNLLLCTILNKTCWFKIFWRSLIYVN